MPLLKPRRALKSPTNQCLQLTSLTRARQQLKPQKALQPRLLKHKAPPTPPNHRGRQKQPNHKARQKQPSHKAQLRLLKQRRQPKPAAQLKQQTCQ